MKEDFKNAIKDPFIKDLVRVALTVLAVLAAAIGIKILRQYLKK